MRRNAPVGVRFESLFMHPWFLPLCFFLFIGVRLALLLFVPVEPSSDAAWYYSRAITLVQQGSYSENGSPTAFWPIGYPAFLAGLFTITGPKLAVVQFANLFFAACSFWLLFRFVRTVFESELAGRLSVLLFTLYPNNAAYVPLVLTETLYTCLMLWVSVLLVTRRSFPALILIGITLGLATLIKTQTLLLAPVLVIIASLRNWSLSALQPAITRAIVVSILMVAVIAPWSLRNYATFGEFILVSTNGGISLLAGNNPSVVGDYRHDYSDTDPLFEQVEFSVANQVESDKRARHLAKQWILENPVTFIGLMPKKFFRFWAPDGEAEWGYQAGTPWYDQKVYWFRFVRIINQVYYFLILVGFAVAIWKLVRTPGKPDLYYGLVIAAYFTLVSLIFSGQSRYHFPIMPFILAYVSWAGVAMFRSKGQLADRPLAPNTAQSASS